MGETRNRIDFILEHCLAAIQDQGCSIDDCLNLYPEQGKELESLLGLAIQLQAGRNIQTTSRFRTETLNRLRSKAATTSRQRPSFFHGLLSALSLHSKPAVPIARPRPGITLQWVAVTVMVLIVAFAGTIAASAQAVPGDFLYPVKRAQEQVQLNLTTNASDQVDLHLKFANRRIAEALILTGQSQHAAIEQVLEDYNERMQIEYSLLTQADGLSPDQRLDMARQFISNMSSLENNLFTLSNQAPPSVQADIQAALATTQKVQNKAREIVRERNIDDQLAPTLQEVIPITRTPTPKINTITPTPSRNTPAPSFQLNPGSLPSETPTPAPSTQTWRTPQDIKATPTPEDTRTPSPNTSSSSIATLSATQTEVKPTLTPQLFIRPSNTPGNLSTPAYSALPGASATPGR